MKLRSRVSHRYARALHDVATQAAALEAVAADLARLQGQLAGSAELRAFLGNHLIPSEGRRRVLAAIFQDRVHSLVWRFLRFLESKRRLGLLDEICADFQEQEEARQGVVRGSLVSAFALAPADAAEVARLAGSRLGCTLLLETGEDPALLGGSRLQVGDTVYDFSLAAQLRMVRQTMIAG